MNPNSWTSIVSGFLGGVVSGGLLVLVVGKPEVSPTPIQPITTASITKEKPPEENHLGHPRKNVETDFNPTTDAPKVDKTDYVDNLASVIGDVEVGEEVFLAPFASVRGDEGTPIRIGGYSNVQDGVVIHALETLDHGVPVPKNQYEVNGKKYAVYIGERVSLAHQSQVHGPAWIEDEVFVGMQSLVFKAHVGKGTIIEPGCTIVGVSVPGGRYVPAGSVVTKQEIADALPVIDENYPLRELNKAVVHVNTSLTDGYSGRKPKDH